MTMRILYVLSNEPTGGVGTVVENYTLHFDDQVIVDFLIYTRQRDTEFQKKVHTENNRIWYLPELSARNLSLLEKKTDDFFREHAGEYSVVHLHFAGIASLVMKPARKYEIPVRAVHSHNTKLSDSRIKNIRNLLMYRSGEKYITDRFACSIQAGNYLFGDHPEHLYYIHNAIDVERYAYNPEVRNSTREAYGISTQRVILSIGRLEKQKNLEFGLEVFKEIQKKLPDSVYLIAGVGPLENELKAKAEELGIQRKVQFLGFTQQVPQLLQAADLLLMPSFYEGLPLSAVEAQDAGLPCLVSDTVTQEVRLTDCLYYQSLYDSAEQWAASALKYTNMPRTSREEEITCGGYNIKVEALKLEDYYKKRVHEEV